MLYNNIVKGVIENSDSQAGMHIVSFGDTDPDGALVRYQHTYIGAERASERL